MGIFKSIIGGGYVDERELEPNFCEYSEIFGKKKALVTCDLNFLDTLPNNALPCCLKFQMDVYIQDYLPTLISESEASYVAMVRSSISEHIGGRYVGQGIIIGHFVLFSQKSRRNREEDALPGFHGLIQTC